MEKGIAGKGKSKKVDRKRLPREVNGVEAETPRGAQGLSAKGKGKSCRGAESGSVGSHRGPGRTCCCTKALVRTPHPAPLFCSERLQRLLAIRSCSRDDWRRFSGLGDTLIILSSIIRGAQDSKAAGVEGLDLLGKDDGLVAIDNASTWRP